MSKVYNLIKYCYLISFVIIVSELSASTSVSDSMEDQVQEIAYLLMCPVCEGQSVAESNSDLAKDMRTIIKKKLRDGESKDEILAYFVNRYGETVLGSPPAKGINWLLWLLPALAIVFGGVGIGYFLYNSKANKETTREDDSKDHNHTETEYLDKIDKELKDFEN